MGAWPKLTSDQLDVSTDTFDFQQSLSDTLGDFGTEKDGFDALVNEVTTELQGQGDPGSSMDEDLAAASAIAGTIDPHSLDADIASLPASLAEGDAVLHDANALLGSVTSPAPAPTAPAPAPAVCDHIDFGTTTGFSQPISRTATYTNSRAQTVTIRSVTLSPDAPNLWSVSPNLVGLQLAPGASVQITITVTASPGDLTGQLTINTDAPDPQPCITWELVAQTPPNVSQGGQPGAPGIPSSPVLGAGGKPVGFGPNA